MIQTAKFQHLKPRSCVDSKTNKVEFNSGGRGSTKGVAASGVACEYSRLSSLPAGLAFREKKFVTALFLQTLSILLTQALDRSSLGEKTFVI